MSDGTEEKEYSQNHDVLTEAIKEKQEHEAEFKYSDYSLEDYVALGVFWVLLLVVFGQFFTRYFLGFSYPWTTEGARYLLIAVTFLGSVVGVRKNEHIFVEFFYRWMPYKNGRVLITLVDLIRIVFMAVGVKLAITILPRTMNNFLSSIRIPLAAVYAIVLLGFVLMLFRSVQIAIKHWKEGYVPMSRENPV